MTKLCNKCYTLNSDSAHFCKECGRELEIICPQCRKVCSMPARSCDGCGYSFKRKKRIHIKPFAILGSILVIVSLVILFPTMRSCSSHYYITHPIPSSHSSYWVCENDTSSEVVTDYDGNTYNTVKIVNVNGGRVVWMTENMRATHDQNGKEIMFCHPGDKFYNNENPRCCAPNNDTSNIKKFGFLYNYKAAKNICPSGWHLPGDGDFTRFRDEITHGGATRPAKRVASKTDWEHSRGNYNVGCDPTTNNSLGLSILPAGYGWAGYGWADNDLSEVCAEGFGQIASIWVYYGVEDGCGNHKDHLGHMEIHHDNLDFLLNRNGYVWGSVRCVKD